MNNAAIALSALVIGMLAGVFVTVALRHDAPPRFTFHATPNNQGLVGIVVDANTGAVLPLLRSDTDNLRPSGWECRSPDVPR